MAALMFVGTSGSDDPTRAAMPFLGAQGAVDAGIEAEVFLLGEAVMLMRSQVAENLAGVGWPPLSEWMTNVRRAGVPIFV